MSKIEAGKMDPHPGAVNIDDLLSQSIRMIYEKAVRSNIGLEAENISDITEIEADSREYQGTCLGLSLTRSLVELYGGRIWLESDGSGRGTTFFFTIPLTAQAS